MRGGWFVGDFDPVVFRTKSAEVGVKHYAAGEANPTHHHRLGTEVTLVLRGRARMGDRLLDSGDIAVVEPFEALDFEAIEDCTVVVFKSGSYAGDKYDGSYQS